MVLEVVWGLEGGAVGGAGLGAGRRGGGGLDWRLVQLVHWYAGEYCLIEVRLLQFVVLDFLRWTHFVQALHCTEVELERSSSKQMLQ